VQGNPDTVHAIRLVHDNETGSGQANDPDARKQMISQSSPYPNDMQHRKASFKMLRQI
jgi:hypothetical protein